MSKSYSNRARGPLLALALVAAVSTADAKKSKSKIPAHPSELSFAELAFEVPDGDSYRHVLSNGVVVYVVEDHTLPLVDIAVRLRVGSYLDDTPGVARLAGTMVRQGGTAARSAEEFDEAVDFLAAEIGTFSGSTQSNATLNCITQVLDPALDLFFEMLRTPAFQQDRLEVQKGNLLETMKQRNDDAGSILSREWDWLVNGESHYSARRINQAELDAIQRDHLVAFHRQYWVPANMALAISGDVDADAILAQLEKRFADWPAGTAAAWPPPVATHEAKPGVYHVEKDIPQGKVSIGYALPVRNGWDDPDVMALAVMNDILGGGGFTSRITKKIRSDEGLAYSAGSGLRLGILNRGEFQVSYQSKSETVALAAALAMELIGQIRDEPVSDEELTTAKNSFIDTFPSRFESADQLAQTFLGDHHVGRPHGYWKTYRDKIRAVTAEDVQRVARQYLDRDKLLFLVVGKWEDMAPGDPDGRAKMEQFGGATHLPLRDPLTLAPLP